MTSLPAHIPGTRKARAVSQDPVTDAELREAYVWMAGAVDADGGEVYIPIFERLHAEIQDRERMTDMRRLARSISQQAQA